MAKTLLSMPDLRYRALENNWSLCVSSVGTADANTAARAALHVQSVLRRDYDLMPD
jgi:hypothetical protein